MANRMCHLCGLLYTDEEGHNYDECVRRCKERVIRLSEGLTEAEAYLREALKIQAQDWWKERLSK